jgi:hypothetical protein
MYKQLAFVVTCLVWFTACATTRSTLAVPASGSGCPRFSAGAVVGRIVSPLLGETSGVVVSRHDPEVLWIHNDSGDGPKLYAIGIDGTHFATYAVSGAVAVDWEDLAGDETYLYVGDTGDNRLERPFVVVYRLREPTPEKPGKSVVERTVTAETLKLVYPGGPKNSETLLVDPQTGDLFLVTKERDANKLYRAPAPQPWGAGQVTLEPVAVDLPFRKAAGWERYGGEVTGGDIALRADAIILRSYWRAYWWPRAPGQSVGEALRGPGCPVPVASPMKDGQGEAIGFGLSGDSYLTIPEWTAGVPTIKIIRFERLMPH